MPLLTFKVLGALQHQRPNFDVSFTFIMRCHFIRLASAPFRLPFGKVWFGYVCCVQRLATKQNTEFGYTLSKFSVQIDFGVLNCDTSPERKPEVDL